MAQRTWLGLVHCQRGIGFAVKSLGLLLSMSLNELGFVVVVGAAGALLRLV